MNRDSITAVSNALYIFPATCKSLSQARRHQTFALSTTIAASPLSLAASKVDEEAVLFTRHNAQGQMSKSRLSPSLAVVLRPFSRHQFLLWWETEKESKAVSCDSENNWKSCLEKGLTPTDTRAILPHLSGNGDRICSFMALNFSRRSLSNIVASSVPFSELFDCFSASSPYAPTLRHLATRSISEIDYCSQSSPM